MSTHEPRKEPITPQQERAQRYLARKKIRRERMRQAPIAPLLVEPVEPAGLVEPAIAHPSTENAPLVHAEIVPATPIPVVLPEKSQAARNAFIAIPTVPLRRHTGALALPAPPPSRKPLHVRRRRRLKLRHMVRKQLRRARRMEQHIFHRFWLTLGSIVLLGILLFVTITGAGAYTAYRFYTDTQQKFIPRIAMLQDLMPNDNLKMYDKNGIIIGQMTDQGIHTTVSLDKVSRDLINATVATEDKNFWSNQGIDILRIIRAALDNLAKGRVVEGGSTITQQLIKNLVVGNEASVYRKLEEITLTPAINSRYSKLDIMQMYLNSIYYGHQAYGIDAAATLYFGLEDQPGKPASMQLDLAQSAMLAGIPSSPSAYDPLTHPQAAFTRFQTVLDLLVEQGYITKVQALDAVKEAQSKNFFKTAPSLRNRAPHFFNFVLSQLQAIFHYQHLSDLSRSDMIVNTTLDITLQDKIQKIAQQHIAELRDQHHLTNAAEVLIDFHTGAILSLLGSIDYYSKTIDGQFDVATQGYRQPGSSFKPYVYVTAFEQGVSPAQAIDDTRTVIDLPDSNPSTFIPSNYDLSFHGHMTLRCALQNSLNVPAVKVLQHVGIDNAMKTATAMGITYKGTPGYSLVLGGLSVRLIDHTSAFGTFANGGVHVPYYAVEKVRFANSGMVYGHPRNPGTRVISPQLAYMMTNVLSDNASRTPEFFDCNVLQLYANSQNDCWQGNRGAVRPAAAKTGTTNDFRDNWTMGYTTDYVMGVWAGNNDNSPMWNVTGVQGAAPIWHDSLLVAEQGKPIQDFAYPGGLERATVVYGDGVKTTDWFLPGTAPTFIQVIPTAQPTEPGIGTPVANPTPVVPPVSAPVSRPYCPSSYSFLFQPPANNGASSDWW